MVGTLHGEFFYIWKSFDEWNVQMSYKFQRDVPIAVAFGISIKEENHSYVTRFTGSGETLDLI